MQKFNTELFAQFEQDYLFYENLNNEGIRNTNGFPKLIQSINKQRKQLEKDLESFSKKINVYRKLSIDERIILADLLKSSEELKDFGIKVEVSFDDSLIKQTKKTSGTREEIHEDPFIDISNRDLLNQAKKIVYYDSVNHTNNNGGYKSFDPVYIEDATKALICSKFDKIEWGGGNEPKLVKPVLSPAIDEAVENVNDLIQSNTRSVANDFIKDIKIPTEREESFDGAHKSIIQRMDKVIQESESNMRLLQSVCVDIEEIIE